MRWLLVAVTGCSTVSPAAPVEDQRTDQAAPAIDRRHWSAGDVHMHCAPPDTDVEMGVTEIAKEAREAGLEFVVLTPHLWPSRRGSGFDREWTKMAAEARATKGITMVPGVEWTTGSGHFTVTGFDIATVRGPDFLGSAHEAGAWISVNHPFAVPTRIPGVAISDYDISYRAWSAGGTPQPIDGAEVWNVPLSYANLISKPGGKTGEERAWLAIDKQAREKHRRMTAVGGTDNHKRAVQPTTWVLVESPTETAVLEALRTGATCVGGPESGTLKARTDAGWVRIGGIVAGPRVELAWDGAAHLFIDGIDQGEQTGHFVHVTNGVPHTYRIATAGSRCGFIYANL